MVHQLHVYAKDLENNHVSYVSVYMLYQQQYQREEYMLKKVAFLDQMRIGTTLIFHVQLEDSPYQEAYPGSISISFVLIPAISLYNRQKTTQSEKKTRPEEHLKIGQLQENKVISPTLGTQGENHSVILLWHGSVNKCYCYPYQRRIALPFRINPASNTCVSITSLACNRNRTNFKHPKHTVHCVTKEECCLRQKETFLQHLWNSKKTLYLYSILKYKISKV